MKISNQDKVLLFEQEFVALLCIVALGFVWHFFNETGAFYFWTLLAGFVLYFWMIHEEKVYITGTKHAYFEHTSSYIMIAQTALAIQLVSYMAFSSFWFVISMIVSVVMYSVALSRIILFKAVFRDEVATAAPKVPSKALPKKNSKAK